MLGIDKQPDESVPVQMQRTIQLTCAGNIHRAIEFWISITNFHIHCMQFHFSFFGINDKCYCSKNHELRTCKTTSHGYGRCILCMLFRITHQTKEYGLQIVSIFNQTLYRRTLFTVADRMHIDDFRIIYKFFNVK